MFAAAFLLSHLICASLMLWKLSCYRCCPWPLFSNLAVSEFSLQLLFLQKASLSFVKYFSAAWSRPESRHIQREAATNCRMEMQDLLA